MAVKIADRSFTLRVVADREYMDSFTSANGSVGASLGIVLTVLITLAGVSLVVGFKYRAVLLEQVRRCQPALTDTSGCKGSEPSLYVLAFSSILYPGKSKSNITRAGGKCTCTWEF